MFGGRRNNENGLLAILAIVLMPIAATHRPAVDLAHPRVRGGQDRRPHDARPGRARRCAREARARRGGAADAGEPGDGAHVHREPAGGAARARTSRTSSAPTRRSKSASSACARWRAPASSARYTHPTRKRSLRWRLLLSFCPLYVRGRFTRRMPLPHRTHRRRSAPPPARNATMSATARAMKNAFATKMPSPPKRTTSKTSNRRRAITDFSDRYCAGAWSEPPLEGCWPPES